MSRKYRQHDYQDSDRERKPRPPPRAKGAAGRVESRFQLVTRCNNCAKEMPVVEKVQVTDRCRHCDTDLHTCRNCLHFDPQARNECVKPVEVRVTNKGKNNICEFFEPKILVEKQGAGPAPVKPEDSHRKAFYDLFKK